MDGGGVDIKKKEKREVKAGQTMSQRFFCLECNSKVP